MTPLKYQEVSIFSDICHVGTHAILNMSDNIEVVLFFREKKKKKSVHLHHCAIDRPLNENWT